MQEEIKNKVNNLELNESVIFLGQRNDVNELYQAMDVFLLPSLYEGLGMVLIEAQCSGLPCICSTQIPKIAKVTENLTFVSLNGPIEKWVLPLTNFLTYKRHNIAINKIRNFGYEINEESKKLENKYESLYRS